MSEENPESKTKRVWTAKQVTAILSALIWVLGFATALAIPPTSPEIWLPDTLLLSGFFPLLFFWRPSWPWLVFGIANAFIGFCLQVARDLPAHELPAQMIAMRLHLAQYHVPMVWILIGILSTIYGAIRMLKNMLIWLWAKSRKR